jgi:hypothetical protein
MKDEFKDRAFIDEYQKKYVELKEKETGFSGILYQFEKIEENLVNDFFRSKSINHPGDKGTSREGLLKNFLVDYDYLPKKYGVSKGSSYVISSSGHKSDQVDLLIYDIMNCPKLLTLNDIQFFPVESVYGIIEVKSNLDSKKTLFDALGKISSFKKIPFEKRVVSKFGGFNMETSASHGFGIIFAYDASLKWGTISEYLKEFQQKINKNEWPNLICVLNQGMILQSNEERSILSSNDIERSEKNSLMGMPLGYGNLLNFYLMLMDLLVNSHLPAINISKYAFLDNPSQDKKYRFTYGAVGELGKCKKHGDYLKKITDKNIEKILTACNDADPINWVKALDIAYGRELDEERYKRQPHEVKIYNPGQLPLSDILLDVNKIGLWYEDIIINDYNYWIPRYYIQEEGLIEYCPECIKEKERILCLYPVTTTALWKSSSNYRCVQIISCPCDQVFLPSR